MGKLTYHREQLVLAAGIEVGVRAVDRRSLGVLRRLWRYWLRLRFRLSCLYLDRGFYRVAVLRWLLKRELPFVMAVPKKGKQGGIKGLIEQQGPGVWPYTVRRPKDDSVTLQVAVVGKYLSGRWGKHGRDAMPS